MTRTVESQYRRFLLLTAAATFLAAAVELVLVEHYEDRVQLIPFVLIASGVAAIAWVWFAPEARSLRVLRWVAGAVVLGSLFGVVLHVKGNVEFALEVTPEAPLAEIVWKSVSGGQPAPRAGDARARGRPRGGGDVPPPGAARQRPNGVKMEPGGASGVEGRPHSTTPRPARCFVFSVSPCLCLRWPGAASSGVAPSMKSGI